jgi:hypothetical protein
MNMDLQGGRYCRQFSVQPTLHVELFHQQATRSTAALVLAMQPTRYWAVAGTKRPHPCLLLTGQALAGTVAILNCQTKPDIFIIQPFHRRLISLMMIGSQHVSTLMLELAGTLPRNVEQGRSFTAPAGLNVAGMTQQHTTTN